MILNYFYYCLVAKSYPTLLRPHGLLPAWLCCPWDFTGKNTGVGCQWFRGSNPRLLHLLHWQADSLPLSHHFIIGRQKERL